MYKNIWMMLHVLVNGNAIAGWTKMMDAIEGSDQGTFFGVYTDVDTMHNSDDLIKVWGYTTTGRFREHYIGYIL